MAGPLIFLLIGSVLQGTDCKKFEVNLPKIVQVMAGSCVTVPCSFDVMEAHEKILNDNCEAKWCFSKGVPQLTDRDPKTGDLTKKNCTTTFNNMQTGDTKNYYFRLDCKNDLKYSFSRPSVKIEVTDNFPPPTLTPSSLKIKEGESVSLTCSAPAPCLPHPPTLIWTPKLGDIQETLQENQDKTKFKTSVMNFTASNLYNKQNISCTAVYKKQDGSSDAVLTKSLLPDVSYSPKNVTVSVSPSGSVLENSNVTLTCNSDANPAEHYTWYRADGGQETVIGTGKILNIKVSTDRRNLFCKAVNVIGEGRSNVSQIDVLFPPQILLSSNCTKTANQLNCCCETVGNPTPKTHWFLNGQPVSPSSQVVITNELLDGSHLRSIITVNEPQNIDLSTLLCFSSNSLGSASKQFCVSFLESSRENQGHIPLSGFIATVGALALVVFALLVFIWFQKTHPKPRGIGGDIDTNECLTEENQVPNSIEDAIYANSAELSQARIGQPSNGTDNEEEISESSGNKSEELVYASVKWSRKSKTKKMDNDKNMNLTGASFLKEEKFERGDMLFVSSALEMGSVYAEVKPRNKNLYYLRHVWVWKMKLVCQQDCFRVEF